MLTRWLPCSLKANIWCARDCHALTIPRARSILIDKVVSSCGNLPSRAQGSWLTGQIFQATTMDKTIKLWSIDSGSCSLLRGHKGRVLCMVFSPLGEMLCSGSADGTLRLWHTDGGECVATLVGHEDRVSPPDS
jgi:WD40 repeat protein